MSNACRWPNCAAELADHHLVCDEHWSALPGFLRARIYQSGTFVDEHAAIERENPRHNVLRLTLEAHLRTACPR